MAVFKRDPEPSRRLRRDDGPPSLADESDFAEAVGAYLVSARNLIGIALAVGGVVALGVVAHAAATWVVLTAALLYVAGVVVTPRLVRSRSARTPRGSAIDVRRSLGQLEQRIAGRVPGDIYASVVRIGNEIRELLQRVPEQPTASEDVHVLARMATDYLPETVDGYLRLPAGYAVTHRNPDGRTPYRMVQDQLRLLESRLADISDAMLQGDSDQLAAHGRFLEDKFHRSELRLPASAGEGPPGHAEPSP